MLKSAPNFRDVADLVPGLRKGIIYRSDFVTDLAKDEELRLAGLGIAWVADLRSPAEWQSLPNDTLRTAGAQIAHFDVAAAADPAALANAIATTRGIKAARTLMQGAYRAFPLGAQGALQGISDRLADEDGPVLIHCAAGKDRTGFVVASLLLALGISAEHVERDYLASEGRLHPRLWQYSGEAMASIFPEGIDDEALAVINGTDAAFLQAAIASAEAMFGSFDRYLDAAGYDTRRRSILREKLLR